uniref:cAMP-responsive element-binding protein-like 2 n=1 Tax=Cyprinus carpio carpio TaxID=630221 RepID=A0A9J8ALR9_CYPCA
MDDKKMVAGKVKKPGKRGRKPAKIDLKAKLERSRQSARECRARKKLRYQYLEELVSSKERAICALREEMDMERRELSGDVSNLFPEHTLLRSRFCFRVCLLQRMRDLLTRVQWSTSSGVWPWTRGRSRPKSKPS